MNALVAVMTIILSLILITVIVPVIRHFHRHHHQQQQHSPFVAFVKSSVTHLLLPSLFVVVSSCWFRFGYSGDALNVVAALAVSPAAQDPRLCMDFFSAPVPA